MSLGEIRSALLVLAVGASALNAWYFGVEIVDAHSHAADAEWRRATVGTADPWDKFSRAMENPEAWRAAELRAWRRGVSIEIVIITFAVAGIVAIRRAPPH